MLLNSDTGIRLFGDDSIFFISQSGETADTLAALKEAKNRGALALGICNVVGSTIARESMSGVYIPRWTRNWSCFYKSILLLNWLFLH